MFYLKQPTPIQQIDEWLWVKRDDLIPYSFGGNKARKAILFFQDFDKGDYDCVVTYGSSSSNHCRVISNICAARTLPCYIVSPQERSKETFNSKLISLFGSVRTEVPVNEVHNTIESLLTSLKESGKKPYFIPGGGHGFFGTQAYVECYNEILEWEQEHQTRFDLIFLASGTGTTQAGLVCGQLMNHDQNRQIVGISIARKCPYGREVVTNSVCEYLGKRNNNDGNVVFLDDYVADGYGGDNPYIYQTIVNVMKNYGIPLDPTYTGKAFWGMNEYLNKNKIRHKRILFLHTGGTPLFFNALM